MLKFLRKDRQENQLQQQNRTVLPGQFQFVHGSKASPCGRRHVGRELHRYTVCSRAGERVRCGLHLLQPGQRAETRQAESCQEAWERGARW